MEPHKSNRQSINFHFKKTENIKVRFFEVDENDEPIWEDWGRFSEVDVHHQYAIGKNILLEEEMFFFSNSFLRL